MAMDDRLLYKVRAVIQKRTSTKAFTLGFATLLSVWQCWPLQTVQFGPIDDHRFAQFQDSRFAAFTDGLRNALESLVNIGRTGVFRPYTFVESGLSGLIIGITPIEIFVFICFKYTVVLTLIGILSRQLVTLLSGPIAVKWWVREGVVLSMVTATASINAWQGIIPRTGPSELSLAIGLLLAASSALQLSVSTNPKHGNAVLLFVGVVMSAGSKESGIASVIFLVVPASALIQLSAKSQLLRVGIFLGIVISSIFPFHAMLFTYFGGEIYGVERGPSAIIASVNERVTSLYFLLLVLALLLIRSSIRDHLESRRVIVFFWALLLMWVLDGAIYELNSPNLRYRMIYQIIEVLLLGSALAAGLFLYKQTRWRWAGSLLAFVVVLNVFTIPIDGARELRKINQATTDATTRYWSEVTALAKHIREKQQPVVIFSFDAAADYEPIIALSTYLRYLNVDFPIGVFNAEPANEIWNSPEWLAVQAIETEGRSGLISMLNSIPREGWICVGLAVSLENPEIFVHDLVQDKCASVQRI